MAQNNGVSLFTVLTPEERADFERLGQKKIYKIGDIVMRQGDPSNFVAVLITGLVRIVSGNSDGTQVMLAIRGPGDSIGEMAVIDGSPRSATVEVLRDTTALVISAMEMNKFLDAHPRVMRQLLVMLAGRLRQADRQLRDVVGRTVCERLAEKLLDFAQHCGQPVEQGVMISLRQQELAEMVGASREAIVKALRDLRSRGLIETGRREIIICDAEQLQDLAYPKMFFGNFT